VPPETVLESRQQRLSFGCGRTPQSYRQISLGFGLGSQGGDICLQLEDVRLPVVVWAKRGLKFVMNVDMKNQELLSFSGIVAVVILLIGSASSRADVDDLDPIAKQAIQRCLAFGYVRSTKEFGSCAQEQTRLITENSESLSTKSADNSGGRLSTAEGTIGNLLPTGVSSKPPANNTAIKSVTNDLPSQLVTKPSRGISDPNLEALPPASPASGPPLPPSTGTAVPAPPGDPASNLMRDAAVGDDVARPQAEPSKSTNPAEKIRDLQYAAAAGDAEAQNRLGNTYLLGTGVRKDYAEAVRWYRQAADQGFASAQNNLAAMYLRGFGVRKDIQEAIGWYRKAADKGNITAQKTLGMIHADGMGVPRSSAEAERWFSMAADQGGAEEQYDLAARYLSGVGGVEKNREAAKRWYRKAADQGHLGAQVRIGQLLLGADSMGDGPQNSAEAVLWLRKAADQGDASAYLWLGLIYADGRGMPMDKAAAATWFRQAADRGNIAAQYRLGMMYAAGVGVQQNDAEGYFWLALAASKGDKDVDKYYKNANEYRSVIAKRISTETKSEVQRKIAGWKAISGP
jgi:TPR repeat protein